MGLLSWDLNAVFSFVEPARTPRLTVEGHGDSAVGRCCHTSSPFSYGFDPVFPRSLLDFGGVYFLQ